MGNFFTFKYWLNMRPGLLEPKMQIIFYVVVFLLALGIIVFWVLKKESKKNLYNRIWRKLHSFTIGNFIISLFILFFTYELIPILSSRFWFLLWVLGMLVWLYFIFKDFLKIPKIKQELKKEEEYKKYIP